MNKKQLQEELELQREMFAIMKGNWAEHFKAEKDLTDMYGGSHWRAVAIRNSKEEVRQAIEEQHNKLAEIEAKIAKFS